MPHWSCLFSSPVPGMKPDVKQVKPLHLGILVHLFLMLGEFAGTTWAILSHGTWSFLWFVLRMFFAIEVWLLYLMNIIYLPKKSHVKTETLKTMSKLRKILNVHFTFGFRCWFSDLYPERYFRTFWGWNKYASALFMERWCNFQWFDISLQKMSVNLWPVGGFNPVEKILVKLDHFHK